MRYRLLRKRNPIRPGNEPQLLVQAGLAPLSNRIREMLSRLHILFEFCCIKSTPSPFGMAALGFARREATARTAGPRWVGTAYSLRHSLRGLRGDGRRRLNWLGALWMLLLMVGPVSITRGQLIESFDGGAPRFSLWRDDARAIQGNPPRSEPGVEPIEIHYRNGSFVYLAYPIEPSGVIPELRASIRIRSAQSGIRIGFRVVFPRSRHPATHAPLTEVILGTPHEGAGRWSTSTIANIIPMLEERQRFLRQRDGPEVDLREPYIDAVLLSVYGYPGTNRLQVDDLMVDGMIAPGVLAEEFQGGSQRERQEVPTNEQLRILQSRVPRWIQHQGESLAYLQSLGFNAVIAARSNDSLVLEQAAETGMGLIMPPPSLVPTESQSEQFRPVSAWLLGLSLNQAQIDTSRDRVAMLSRFPGSLARPTIGEAWELYGSYGRLGDWMSVPIPLPTTVRSSQESSQILQSDLRPIAGRNAPITSLWTQPSNEWLAQRQTTTSILGREPWLLPDHDRLQARLQLTRSIMQGSRGWIFRSGVALDVGDETAAARATSYAGLNREIDLLMPWIQAGESTWRNIRVDSANHAASILETPNSQLILIVATGGYDQVCSPAPNPERIAVTLPVSGQPREIYRITHGQLERCAAQSRPGGMVVTIERPGLIEQIVTVADNGPVAYLREAFARTGPEIAENRIDIATQLLQLAQMTLIARQLPPADPAWEQIGQAQGEARAAANFLARSDLPRACRAADQAALMAQGVIRASWDEALTQFQSVASSPLVASPLALPLHWELNRVLRDRAWERLSLPGVPFRDLESWRASGWRSDHRSVDSIDSSVAITPQVGPAGFPTMLLSATSRDGQPIPSGYAGASMRVTSPRISVPYGAMVHIEGLVQISSPSDQSQSGLLVCDNMGGEALGQLFSSYDPSDDRWRRISLFRVITQPDGLELYFETRGQVQAAVTDLSIEMILPTQNRSLPISTTIDSSFEE